jgi:hypothetical protein
MVEQGPISVVCPNQGRFASDGIVERCQVSALKNFQPVQLKIGE